MYGQDLEELMVIYREMVAPVVAKHKVFCITGICLGGEHALLLAQQLYADKAEKPHVVVMDGEIDRDTRRETNGHLHFDSDVDDPHIAVFDEIVRL